MMGSVSVIVASQQAHRSERPEGSRFTHALHDGQRKEHRSLEHVVPIPVDGEKASQADELVGHVGWTAKNVGATNTEEE